MPTNINGTTGVDKVQNGVVTNDSITEVAATKLTGTVPTARLGSGTANNTTFLRGDNTWQAISVTPSTADVLAATAGATAGAVGTYAFLYRLSQGLITFGTTYAGSGLTGLTVSPTADFIFPDGFLTPLTGTWRALGSSAGNVTSQRYGTLFLRIS